VPTDSARLPEPRPAPLAALGRESTPLHQHFRRSHYPYADGDASGWVVEVAGAVRSPAALRLGELAALPTRSVDAVLECAGHRRVELSPAVPGVPWGAGAVSQAGWRGASLALVLERAGVRPEAVEVVLHGADGRGEFARAIPLAKALDPETLLAWEVDGGPVPQDLGGPLRALVPGHYAVDSVKWLRRIELVTEPFRGHYQAQDYCYFGAEGIPEGTALRELEVSSLITSTRVADGSVAVRGVAWGAEPIARVELRAATGPWREAALGEPLGRYAFTPWSAELGLGRGEHELASRATDAAGRTQPDEPVWNALGYGNNSVHRVSVTVA
jgi:DMSO/TMAO reductase YedYZ molybdopterin-dependent catalytic subunit